MLHRPIGTVIALVALLHAPPQAASAGAQASPRASASAVPSDWDRYAITGVVTDAGGKFLIGADLALGVDDSIVARSRSGEHGEFRFADMLVRRFTVTARHLGYEPTTTSVLFNGGDTVVALHITLDRVARLATVDVDALAPGAKLRGFQERASHSTLGRFFTRSQIERSRATRVSELLRGLPGVRIQNGTVWVRGCRPAVWIDGVHLHGAEVDNVAPIENVAALEEYPSWGALPAQFQDRTQMCGALIVWTRDGPD